MQNLMFRLGRGGWLMKLMQVAVFCGVYFPMAEAYRGENAGFAIGILALMATIFATACVIEIQDRIARFSARAAASSPRRSHAAPPSSLSDLRRPPADD